MKNKTTKEISATLTGRKTDEYLIVSVYYSKGGISMFTYKEEARGYWLSVSVREREIRDGFRIEKYPLFKSGLKFFIEPAARFNAKRLAEIVPDAMALESLTAQVLEMTKQEASTHE